MGKGFDQGECARKRGVDGGFVSGELRRRGREDEREEVAFCEGVEGAEAEAGEGEEDEDVAPVAAGGA